MEIKNTRVAVVETIEIVEVTIGDDVHYVRRVNGTKLGPAFKTIKEAREACRHPYRSNRF